MRDCIDAMERAFAEEARGIAVNKPRTRYKVPPDLDKPGYMANIIPGAVPSFRLRRCVTIPPSCKNYIVAGGRALGLSIAFETQLGLRDVIQFANRRNAYT